MNHTHSMVVAFAGPTGVGKSTLLINVAGIIQKYSDKEPKICLVDMDLFYPSLVHLLHQDDMEFKEVKLNHIMERIEALPLEVIEKSAMKHTPTGIALYTMELGEVNVDPKLFSPEKISLFFDKLRQIYDLVLIDTSANLKNDETLVSLAETDKIVLITNPDINKVLHTRKILDVMKVIDTLSVYEKKMFDKSHVVLNRFHPKKGMDAKMIEKALFEKNVNKTIEENSEITTMGNNGMFFYNKTSKEARSMIELARIVYRQDNEKG